MRVPENNRILVVDDNPLIHDDFSKILAPPNARAEQLTAAEAVLFGRPEEAKIRKVFDIHSAYQGQEALEKVRAAVEAGRPYAMAFVDVRMPPGWDGVETITHLWQAAPDLQIVICTAYSDYSWHDIARRVAAPHNMVVLKKPFDNIEVLQLAHALCHKWRVTAQANAQLSHLNELVAARTAELQAEVTERRRTEEVLRESEERFRAFMDNSPAVAFIKDREGRYVYMNKPFERHFGIKVTEWAGKTDFDVWPHDLAEQMRANEAVVLQTERPQEFTETIPTPGGGSAQWLVLKFTLRDRTGQKFIGGVGVDVTHRNRLEAERRQSQKLEAVGQLAGGVAHDFNNILAVIIGYSEAARERAEPGSELARDLDEIMKAANRGTGLIAQLLAFSRKEVMWPRVIDVNAALIEIDRILHRLIRENIYMTLLLGPDAGCVKVDPGQIEQVVINLVVNARDAMAGGGELRVETHSAFVGVEQAEEHGVAPGEYVVIQVSDTGIGMAPETCARIFEPFFTTKESSQGTGLGLATCYGIAKQNGGFISVNTAPGQGSTFRVYLPKTELAAHAAPEVDAGGELPSGHERVLVVEDDEALRDLTADTLRTLGYEVVEASDGEEAQRILMDGNAGKIDLVMSDVGMPKLDGASLAKWAAAERPDVKVLLVSGYLTDKRLGTSDLVDYRFLPKPFTRRQLAASVRKALDHSDVPPATPNET
jgi:two-component system, cell cycle sensor histidine kinase and response regulator CckA